MSRKDDARAINAVYSVMQAEVSRLVSLMDTDTLVAQVHIDNQAKKSIESIDALKSVIKIVRR